MSTQLLSLDSPATTQSSVPARRARNSWLREPLLHFALAGSLLFALDHFLVTRADDPHTIIMDQQVDAEARRLFAASRGRAPNAEELRGLRQVWLDNEILYREGLALQVDKGDSAIRERVIFKALSVIDANVRIPDIDDQALRAWFIQHRDKYDEPERFDFEEGALAGTPGEADVRAFVASLNGGLQGDARAGLRVFKGRPQSNIVQSYGDEFATELAGSAVGQWRALKAKDGSWRAVRLTALAPARPADYEAMRGPILQDWKDASGSEQRTAAVRTLAKKYHIVTPAQGK